MFQLGIDVSKKTLDLCLLREGVKGKVKSRKLKNDFNAASVVINWLHKQHSIPEDVHIIMEATGAKVSLATHTAAENLPAAWIF
jgi:transposase